MDTAAWLAATQGMRRALAGWVLAQRAAGIDVVLRDVRASGWPLTATLNLRLDIGPGGVPAGLIVRAALAARLSPAHPTTLRATVDEVRLATPAAELVATADVWTAAAPLAAPAVRSDATGLRLRWPGHDATLAQAHAEQTGPADRPRLQLSASGIDLADSGLALPAALGPMIQSADADATLVGGWPVAAPTAAASARAWRDAGGALELARLAVTYGPLRATARGRFTLDSALRPAGAGLLFARGLVPLLDALGVAGLIPPRAGQAAAGMLALLGPASGDVDIPFGFGDGRLVVAGFPLAQLPPLIRP